MTINARDEIVELAPGEPVQEPMFGANFEPSPGAEQVPATLADIERLEHKIDQMTATFENLGTHFEGAIGEFLNGPMGKLFGKLVGKSDG